MKTSGYSYAQDNLVQDNSTDGREELSVLCLPARCPGLGDPLYLLVVLSASGYGETSLTSF